MEIANHQTYQNEIYQPACTVKEEFIKTETEMEKDEYAPVKEECGKYAEEGKVEVEAEAYMPVIMMVDTVEDTGVVVKEEDHCGDKTSADNETESKTLVAMDLLKRGNKKSFPGAIFKCSECGHIPIKQTKKEIKSHMAMHRDSLGLKRPFTKSDTVDLTCSYCQKTFKAFSDLQRHLLQHTGERTWQCEVCPKSFGLKYHLTRHMDTHSDTREQILHMCKTCGKEFTSSRSRNVHELSHSGLFLYHCEHCNKGFNEKSIMQKHQVKRHGGSYDHFCDQCGKGFMTSRALNTHSPICGIIKPKKKKKTESHPCVICNKIFNRKCNLERHIKSHNDEKEHTCDQCGKQFRDYRSIRSHTKKKHESNNTEWEMGVLEAGVSDTADENIEFLDN